MGISKFGAGLACTVMTLGFAGVAHADFVKTVTSEAECAAQSGDIMDFGDEKHCFVPVVPKEFQTIDYAGELKGVTECEKANVRKSQIGDFCLIKLDAEPATVETVTTETPEITEALPDIANEKIKKAAEEKAPKIVRKILGE